jgi:hypothetical protein
MVAQEAVSNFVEEVKRYDPSLGSEAPKGYYHGTWSKTKWALYFSKKIPDIRDRITAQATTINLLFQSVFSIVQPQSADWLDG